ncbi:MAG: cytochrome b/b6 domain-containing protein [Proteobacteria bacterium]|nr:cytochrome b/b6 domain-containing protein [Pseudomonadota bacterium]
MKDAEPNDARPSGQAPNPGPASLPGDLIYRHRLPVRVWHWTNALILLVMLESGLMIFNAHPRLYWGKFGANPDPAWLDLSGGDGIPFPGWVTLPSYYSLADARLWHLAVAWLLVLSLPAYLVWAVVGGHVRRDLLPRRAELRPGHIWHDIAAHARLRFPHGEAARSYNVLQKLAYGAVLFVLLPGMILTGLAMSPAMDAGFPVLLDMFGGRQSARSIHFICAFGLAVFFVVHIVMVILAGPINEVRSMLSGWYRLPAAREGRP